MTKDTNTRRAFAITLTDFVKFGFWSLITLGFFAFWMIHVTYSLNLWQYALGLCVWFIWISLCSRGMWIFGYKPDIDKRLMQSDESWANLDAAIHDAHMQIERMNRESDERMAAFEIETQRFIEEHTLPVEPESVLSRIRDLDVETTTHRDVDGQWSVNVRPRMLPQPK